MRAAVELYALNRGRISPLAQSRHDVKRVALAAETLVNIWPTTLGPMRFRPGTQFIDNTYSNAQVVTIPFVFAADDSAGIEIHASAIRVMVDDVFITRPTVTAAVTNGAFTSDITSWTDTDEAGGVSAWDASGALKLTGDGTDYAGRRQALTINEIGTVHALRIVVTRGPVTLRLGSTSGGKEYHNASLAAGTHSIAWTPTGATTYIEFRNSTARYALVDSVTVESAGDMVLPSPWSAVNLYHLRYEQSGDIVFVASDGSMQQYQIERRANDSWSIVKYLPENGPYRLRNTSTITLAPSVRSGNGTLTASKELFSSTHVGALFTLTSAGQYVVNNAINGADEWTANITVTGVGEARRFTFTIDGTFTATVTLQRSADGVSGWVDVTTWTTATTPDTYADGLDNQIWYYRIGVDTGDYTSGTVQASLNYPGGTTTGHARVTGYTSETVVSIEIMTAFGSTDATDNWSESVWSDYRGWPSSVVLHDGRLWWGGKDRFLGSITDQFWSFDPEYVGDAGPVSRTIGSGPVDTINWLASAQRLIAGTDGGALVCRSTSFDEPLTPTNFRPKAISTQGAARVNVVKLDDSTLYVQRAGFRLMELAYDIQKSDYSPSDLSEIVPDIGDPGFVQLAVQRQPEPRVHALRSDGTVAVLAFNRAENLMAWADFETDGTVESVMVLPGVEEDRVYYTVLRTINGATYRFHEKLAMQSETNCGASNKTSDCHVVFTRGAASRTITGLGHLEGKSVVCWANSKAQGTFTVSGASITLPTGEDTTLAIVGLPYMGDFQSTPLGLAVQGGESVLTSKKRSYSLGAVLHNTYHDAVSYGPDTDHLDPLPAVYNGADVDAGTTHTLYRSTTMPLQGSWGADSRICFRIVSPGSATVGALAIGINDVR